MAPAYNLLQPSTAMGPHATVSPMHVMQVLAGPGLGRHHSGAAATLSNASTTSSSNPKLQNGSGYKDGGVKRPKRQKAHLKERSGV